MDWNDDIISRLRTLWSEGLSTAEIGRQLGVTKNAVVGKAHRLDLPSRPSPIRRGGPGAGGRTPQPRRVAGPTLPPLACTRTAEAESANSRPPAAPALRVAAVSRSGGGRTISCCWPIGEPGTRSFRFCDADSAPGKPYCAEHATVAYVRVRDRREDAA